MPTVSKKQEKFMQAVAHNPEFAKKVGVPQKVGKEFTMKKYTEGGMMKKEGRGMAKADMQKKTMKGYASGGMPMVEKDGKKVPAFAADGVGKMKKGGIATSLKAHAAAPASKAHAKMAKGGAIDGCATKGKTKGTMVKMAKGGRSC